ncbi:ImmA/IrrE family metallo-endopeptidase [Gaoshiqia sediminis]|uniref:ImmA/IrrE family metallo-endopeptidase n=1 Tax=Gaoshiqia sediminis TaxID=2986998 RepID=A0AA42CB06_9BACT|nr:ImmA/IrrE family metallo-endopeptidase [Gaoshiqia sediminis]MCW0484562.1 ImmA/IrrE family metallo-endopeptidase [Gaoshiqia sediminis]
MATLNQYQPNLVFHPGATLGEKLEEMGMSVKEFALRTGKPEKTIFAILKEESSITPEMAVQFENVTRIPASFWINKQARYNEYVARLKQEQAIAEAEDWACEFPYAEMAKRGWVPPTRKKVEKTINLLSYFGVASHHSWNKLYVDTDLKVAAYTSLKFTHEAHAISAWLRQGELQAAEIAAPEFNVKKLKGNIPAMRRLMVEQPVGFFLKLQELCLEAGVVLLFTPKLPKVPLSGSTRWIKEKPLIQLTARYGQNDRFWFTFFHELGHIILHGKKYISLENVDFAASDAQKEQEAHDFAVKLTFSKEQEEKLLQEHPTSIAAEDIVNYAIEFDTHPALIIGRLQHLGLIAYSVGREFLLPVQLSEFVFDGSKDDEIKQMPE